MQIVSKDSLHVIGTSKTQYHQFLNEKVRYLKETTRKKDFKKKLNELYRNLLYWDISGTNMRKFLPPKEK